MSGCLTSAKATREDDKSKMGWVMKLKVPFIVCAIFVCGSANAGQDQDRHEAQVDALYQIMRSIDESLVYAEQLNKKRYEELLEDLDRQIDLGVSQINSYRGDKAFDADQKYINETLVRVKKIRSLFPSTAIRAGAYERAKNVLFEVEASPTELKEKPQPLFSASFFHYPGLDNDDARIELFEDGRFKAEWGFVFEPNIDEGKSNRQPAEICKSLRSIGFMALPENIAPETLGLHGPDFYIRAECDRKLWRVWYRPEFRKKDFKPETKGHINTFVASWNYLWSHSQARVKQPPLDGGFFESTDKEL